MKQVKAFMLRPFWSLHRRTLRSSVSTEALRSTEGEPAAVASLTLVACTAGLSFLKRSDLKYGEEDNLKTG